MPCDTRTLPNQTLTERKLEVREAIAKLSSDLIAGRAKTVVGPQGAVAFTGWQDRRRVSDACAYRLLMATGSALAKQQIAKAEQLAGRSVDRRVINAGVHSHDSGASWHHGH